MSGALTALAAFHGPLASPSGDLFAFFVWEVVSARTLRSGCVHALSRAGHADGR